MHRTALATPGGQGTAQVSEFLTTNQMLTFATYNLNGQVVEAIEIYCLIDRTVQKLLLGVRSSESGVDRDTKPTFIRELSMKSGLLKFTMAVVASALAAAASATPSTVWTNNAGPPTVQSFNTATGVVGSSFAASGSNGRGVVVVGDVVYTTDANSSFIGRFDRTTGASLGGCSVAGFGGFSTIGFDGDAFWTSDYTGGNSAYRIDTDCNVLKTVTLSLSEGFYDGLEFFNGKLIANRFDGGFGGGNQYSVYDTDGLLLQANFIDTTGHGNGTGIAFDGENFWISDVLNNSLTIWDGTSGAYLDRLVLTGSNNLIEDLSFDYEERPDTCRVNCNTVPEPSSLPLTGLVLFCAAWVYRRRLSGAESHPDHRG